MQPVFIDQLDDSKGYPCGIAVFWETVSKNLPVLFNAAIVETLLHNVKTEPDQAFYFFQRYGQFIVQVTYERPEGLLMRFTDYKGNTDAVLDEYAAPHYNGLDSSALSQVMALLLEMKEQPKGEATMEKTMAL